MVFPHEAFNCCQQAASRVNVFLAEGAVHVLSRDLRARENMHRGCAARDLLHLQAVPVVAVVGAAAGRYGRFFEVRLQASGPFSSLGTPSKSDLS